MGMGMVTDPNYSLQCLLLIMIKILIADMNLLITLTGILLVYNSSRLKTPKQLTFVVSVFPVPAGPSGAPFKFKSKAPTSVR